MVSQCLLQHSKIETIIFHNNLDNQLHTISNLSRINMVELPVVEVADLSAMFAEEKKDDDNILFTMSSTTCSTEDIGSVETDEDKKKVVKFADDEAEKHDAQRDQERSRQELLTKIARLTDILNDAQDQIQTERNKRKKKEKSLLKLAKELKKRNSVREQEADRLEELEEKKKYLEHHWVLAQKELDQEKALHTKLQEESQKEYEETIKEEKRKFERTSHENENRLADLKKAHIDQCEELGQEALKAKLEADRLHSELILRGIDVPRHSLLNKENHKKIGFFSRSLVPLFVAVLGIAYVSLGSNPEDLFTKSGICGPIMPGTILDDNAYGTFQAPWWAPASLKEKAFTSLCTNDETESKKWTKNSNVPSSIEWIRDGKNNKLIISKKGSVALKRSIAKSQIKSNKILFWKRNGNVEEVSLNWA